MSSEWLIDSNILGKIGFGQMNEAFDVRQFFVVSRH